ncbi:hypothetical protein T492DRAFT_972151 [Pavlovales sp. CCMP2436]|nr:hypothetical protein T492DRAFT_972151 [Pavlovales sp. CCMP2436]
MRLPGVRCVLSRPASSRPLLSAVVRAPVSLVRSLAVYGGGSEIKKQRAADDCTFSEEAGGGSFEAPVEDFPLELEHDGQPLPNTAVLVPVPPSTGGADNAGQGQPLPQDRQDEAQVFRAARIAPLAPGVAYVVRVVAVSEAHLHSPPSVELRYVTPNN